MRWPNGSLLKSKESVISKPMKKTVLPLAATLMLVACGGNVPKKTAADGTQATAAAASDMHNAENALDYPGTYEGTLPAADCPGIQTTLTLDPDGAYSLHRKYVDREAQSDEQGRYTVEGNLLTLYPDEGEPTDSYRVEENRLRMLDAGKKPVTGALAEHYVLKKTR